MEILTKKVNQRELKEISKKDFGDMETEIIKCVVDVEKLIMGVSAEYHSDIEELLLNEGLNQENLFGLNLIWGDLKIQFQSMLNIPWNLQHGYRDVENKMVISDKDMQEKMIKVVDLWVEGWTL